MLQQLLEHLPRQLLIVHVPRPSQQPHQAFVLSLLRQELELMEVEVVVCGKNHLVEGVGDEPERCPVIIFGPAWRALYLPNDCMKRCTVLIFSPSSRSMLPLASKLTRPNKCFNLFLSCLSREAT